jgi:hypothetical protein
MSDVFYAEFKSWALAPKKLCNSIVQYRALPWVNKAEIPEWHESRTYIVLAVESHGIICYIQEQNNGNTDFIVPMKFLIETDRRYKDIDHANSK